MSDIAYIKCSSLLASATGLWLASMSPTLALPVQGLCLGGALAACGFAVDLSRRCIRPEAMARVREGLNFAAIQKEMAVAAASLEQATKSRYFPNEVDHPMQQRAQLEQAFASSPGPVQVGPELVRAVRAMRAGNLSDDEIAIAVLGGADAASGVNEILEIGEQQGW